MHIGAHTIRPFLEVLFRNLLAAHIYDFYALSDEFNITNIQYLRKCENQIIGDCKPDKNALEVACYGRLPVI